MDSRRSIHPFLQSVLLFLQVLQSLPCSQCQPKCGVSLSRTIATYPQKTRNKRLANLSRFLQRGIRSMTKSVFSRQDKFAMLTYPWPRAASREMAVSLPCTLCPVFVWSPNNARMVPPLNPRLPRRFFLYKVRQRGACVVHKIRRGRELRNTCFCLLPASFPCSPRYAKNKLRKEVRPRCCVSGDEHSSASASYAPAPITSKLPPAPQRTLARVEGGPALARALPF